MLAVVQGPLLQRASSLVLVTELRTVDVTVNIPARVLERGSTGIMVSERVTSYNESFAPAVRAFNNREPMEVEHTGCGESCKVQDILAPGFDVNCTHSKVPFNFTYSNKYPPNATFSPFKTVIWFAGEASGDIDSPEIAVLSQYKTLDNPVGDLVAGAGWANRTSANRSTFLKQTF